MVLIECKFEHSIVTRLTNLTQIPRDLDSALLQVSWVLTTEDGKLDGGPNLQRDGFYVKIVVSIQVDR